MCVRVKFSGDDLTFWFNVIVNGREVGRSIPVEDNEAFNAIESRINETLNAVYEKGKQDGAHDAKVAIKRAMGL